MKTLLTSCWLLAGLFGLVGLGAQAQSVGIGTATPNASAALDVRASNKGVLFPQVSLTGLADAATVPAPAPALLVFNTNAALPGGLGFYYNAGTALAPAWTRLNTGPAPASPAWGLNGNTATDSTLHYLGTTDVKPLRLGTNGVEQARLHTNGALWLGGLPVGTSPSFPDNHLLLGYQAGKKLNPGSFNNQFVGYQAGLQTTSGLYNQFEGFQSGYANTTGSKNVFSGVRSGFANTTGTGNVFGGYRSGAANTTGSNNWAFGYEAGPSTGNLTNAGAIGYNAAVGLSNSLVLGSTGPDAVSVGIGTATPSPQAALDLSATDRGLLIPRLSAAQRTAIASPPQGLTVYQTDGSAGGGAGTGFWYNQGTALAPRWVRLADADGVRYDPLTGLQVGPGSPEIGRAHV